MAREVTCVTTDDASDYDDCRCIQTIGYTILSSTYTKTPKEVHDSIEDDGKEYYIEHYGSKTYLEAVGSGSNRYVRTEANDTEDDNLLEQPSC